MIPDERGDLRQVLALLPGLGLRDGIGLQRGAERGQCGRLDDEPAALQLRRERTVDELADRLGVPADARAVARVRPVDLDRHRRGARACRLVDQMRAGHAREDLVAARPGGIGMMKRIEPARRLDQAREQGGLREVDRADRAIEVRVRGGRHAIGALAEEHEAEIDLEDVALGPALLDAPREQCLADLAPRAALVADLDRQQVARDLLGDRRRAADDALGLVVRPRGPHDRAVIDAVMREEPHVLGGEHRLDELRWQLVERDQRAVTDDVGVLERQLGEVRAIGGDDQRGLRRQLAPRGEIRNVGQVACPPAQRQRDDATGDDR